MLKFFIEEYSVIRLFKKWDLVGKVLLGIFFGMVIGIFYSLFFYDFRILIK